MGSLAYVKAIVGRDTGPQLHYIRFFGAAYQKSKCNAICRNRGLPTVCWIRPSDPKGGQT